MVMVYVPGGTFPMGSDDEDVEYALQLCNEYSGDLQRAWLEDEQPMHDVTLDAFWIDQTEVTNAQYALCVADGGCEESHYADDADFNGDNYPVVGVSWYDAAAYCEWAEARLPTEAEWEYAARGEQGHVYPWGNNFECSRGNFDDETAIDDYVVPGGEGCDGYERAAPVGSLPSGASWCKALDIGGNVGEWVADWYESDYYERSPAENPLGPEKGDLKVARGGSWHNDPDRVRCAFRAGIVPGAWSGGIGFRCARSAAAPTATALSTVAPSRAVPSSTSTPPSWFSALTGRVAYYSPRFQGIVIRDLESGADPTGRITEDWSYDPAWSPDGTKLAFVQGNDDLGYSVYAMEIPGGEPMTVTARMGYVHDSPSWSPDGKRLVFREQPLEDRDLESSWLARSRIMIVNADGTGLRPLIDVYPVPDLPFDHDHAESPCWSPDGDYVMFSAVTTASAGGHAAFRHHIFKVSLDLSEVRDLTPMDLEAVSQDYYQPAWSPDGTRFAYVCAQAHPEWQALDIQVADSNSGRTVSTLTWMMFAWEPAWSPDGQYVAFCMEDGIHVTRANGSPEDEPLFIDHGRSPSWTR
jgi:formylglycine-generating enzyme required for sulfatase activity/Tol biopolymer transport system component